MQYFTQQYIIFGHIHIQRQEQHFSDNSQQKIH